MILAFRRPCADHRPALTDFVDRRQVDQATAAALAHLEGCAACERELAETSLTITALRRLQAEVARLEPPPDAWPRLRDRVTRPVEPWRWHVNVGGLLSSALLAAVLVLPLRVGSPAVVGGGLELSENPDAVRRESAYIAATRTGTLPATPQRTTRVDPRVPRVYPPEIAKVRKEVNSTPPPMRPSKPI